VPMTFNENLIDFLKSSENSGKGITFIANSDQESFLSYQDLSHRAQAYLANLRQAGAQPGHQVIIQVADNKEFLILFWACLMGKIIPVPVTLANTDEYRHKLLKIWQVLERPFAAFDRPVYEEFEHYLIKQGHGEGLSQVCESSIFPEEFTPNSNAVEIENPKGSDTAYIQFSSGSTGDPKGIILTHENLLSNIHSFLEAKNARPDDSYISWLPLTHDMGLIGWHLNPLVADVNQYIMPAKAFVSNPSLWFEKVNEHRITILGSPNFGFTHFLKFAGISSSNGWDLSCVRLIVTGAEPISLTVCHSFLDLLFPFGLKPDVLMPGYGLAEATLAVSVSPCTEEIVTHFIDIRSLGMGNRVEDIEDSHPYCVVYMDEGRLLSGFEVKICDAKGNQLAQDVIGEIYLKGPSVSSGYFNNPKATACNFTRDQWLKTGDLGFLRNQRLIITGRLKELIIIAGMNFYPQDIERLASTAPGVKLNSVVACGASDAKTGSEELIIFASHKKEIETFVPLAEAIKEKVAANFNLPVSRVIPIKSIPRTTSGKIQRTRLVSQYQKGVFDPVIQKINQIKYGSLNKIDMCHMEPGQRLIRLTDFVMEQIKNITGKEKIDHRLSMVSQGVDSLMAIEIRNILESAMEISIPVSWFRKDDPLNLFCEKVAAVLISGKNKTASSSCTPLNKDNSSSLSLLEQLQNVDNMSEEQIQEMIKMMEN
ncbi:MAG: AMP-binding protein, partial [Desulfobacteraceae bacterium]|nr:AMP-binding protein [Desulfobacteraceae bacterium]